MSVTLGPSAEVHAFANALPETVALARPTGVGRVTEAIVSPTMTTRISRHVRALIEDVFAFFDDLSHTLEFNPHAERIDVVHHKPDGRRTYDVVMRTDTNEWMQTVEQVLREPPTRLVTRGGSWTNDRRKWLLTIATDRRFSVDGDGTRIDITIESRLDQPLRRPLQAIRNWLWRGAAQRGFEHQLALIAKRLEAP